jgi:hypothetical protein
MKLILQSSIFVLPILCNSFIIYVHSLLLITGNDITRVYSLPAVGRMFQGTDDTLALRDIMCYLCSVFLLSHMILSSERM